MGVTDPFWSEDNRFSFPVSRDTQPDDLEVSVEACDSEGANARTIGQVGRNLRYFINRYITFSNMTFLINMYFLWGGSVLDYSR